MAQLEVEEQLASFVEMFGNATRLAILRKLQEKRMRMAHLAREMDVPIQEIHRNTIRLMQTGLVRKDQDSLVGITPLGIAATIQLESLEFISSHKEYFTNHTLLHLPDRSFLSIAALKSCSVMSGSVPILEKIGEFYERAAFLKAIAPQVPLDHLVKVAIRVKQEEINVSYILGQNTIVPKGRKELLESLGWNSLIRKGLVKRRMTAKIHVGLIVTDKNAGVLFPDSKGNIDSNIMFYGDSKVFLKWCEDLFSEQWAAADEFDDSRLQES